VKVKGLTTIPKGSRGKSRPEKVGTPVSAPYGFSSAELEWCGNKGNDIV